MKKQPKERAGRDKNTDALIYKYMVQGRKKIGTTVPVVLRKV